MTARMHGRRFAAWALVAACAAMAGCSSLNPLNWFRGDPKAKIPDLAPINATATLRTLWQANIGAAGEAAVFFPALVTGHVYTAARDGSVTSLDAATGKVEWKISAG